MSDTWTSKRTQRDSVSSEVPNPLRVRNFQTGSRGIENRGDIIKASSSHCLLGSDSGGDGSGGNVLQGAESNLLTNTHCILLVGGDGVGETALTQQLLTSNDVIDTGYSYKWSHRGHGENDTYRFHSVLTGLQWMCVSCHWMSRSCHCPWTQVHNLGNMKSISQLELEPRWLLQTRRLSISTVSWERAELQCVQFEACAVLSRFYKRNFSDDSTENPADNEGSIEIALFKSLAKVRYRKKSFWAIVSSETVRPSRLLFS